MDPAEDIESPAVKKRRIPKACGPCRRSKVRCDEERPCGRCVNSGFNCTYVERPKDPVAERFERLESAVTGLQEKLNFAHGQPSPMPTHSSVSWDDDAVSQIQRSLTRVQPTSGLSGFTLRTSSTIDVVSAGIVAERNSRNWFATFFEGCDRFVPVFHADYDTYESVRGRSNILFDVIIAYGCRVASGVLSKDYQKLYGLVRQHTSDLVLKFSGNDASSATLEDIQALILIASYTDSGAVLSDIAVKAAMQAGLPSRLDELFASIVSSDSYVNAQNQGNLYSVARVWYSTFNLDQILSLDGGKSPSVHIHSSPQRVRALLVHPQRTAADLRLLAQVELNALRSSSYILVVNASRADGNLSNTVTGALLDLKLWLSEWQTIVCNDSSLTSEHPIMLLNLQVQHAWAVLTLHLRALTASGIENIALMTEGQRSIALAAKSAAEQHLKLLLTNVQMPGDLPTVPYVANLKYAMEFVWAKNSFLVLIVLRLGLLLGDPPSSLIERLLEAKQFLRELEKVGMGVHISYMRLLSQTVDKCERAVRASMQAESERTSAESSDTEFQSFVPKEFLFMWDFPGLHLCYIPLDWQDLFLDFGTSTA